MNNQAVIANSVADSLAARAGKLYQMLLDSIPSSVLLLDATQHILSVNRNFLRKAHVTESEVLGQLLETVFPAAMYQHMNLRRRVAEVFNSGVATKGERMVYRAPGLAARTYYYSLIPVRWEKTVENVMLLMEDVTDQIRLGEEARRAERHLASVVESANDMVLSMDTSGRIMTWNNASVHITGFEESEVRNRSLASLCPSEQGPSLAKILERVKAEGRTSPVEVEILNRDGRALPISWIFSAMRDTDGRMVGLVAVGRDLTERRKFESQLLQSEKLAALGVMAGGIAHEIRNPLAVVFSGAQLLLEGGLTQALQKECAERIYRNVQRAAGIIESLMRFARPADLGLMKTIDLTLPVKEALALVANEARLAKVNLHAALPQSPVLVRGNASLLQQLIMNLLLNAIHAIPEQGGDIALALETRPDRAILCVSDTGRGIPADLLPKVFDPFFTTMPVGRGTGLGLSISYAIVQQHQGRIDIASEPGKGTTVTVTLPVKEA